MFVGSAIRVATFAILTPGLLAVGAIAHGQRPLAAERRPPQPSVYRTAERTDARARTGAAAGASESTLSTGKTTIAGPEAAAPANVAVADPLLPLPGEHPMMPALRWAKTGLEDLRQVHDYSATLVKRERIDGVLGEHQYMEVKVRHKPFSVYIYFLSPVGIKGQEVIYVEGKHDNQMKAHTVGLRDSIVGTVTLDPNGRIAMQGQRYPITETGVLNLTEKLVEVGRHDSQYGECTYKAFKGAKINGRLCTCLQFVHPVPRKEFRFHLARIFVDEEMNLPTRYEAYDWPTEKDGKPLLTEEYTYVNLKLNNGFTDIDFDVKNPKYKFR